MHAFIFVLAFAPALLFWQAPEFTQQYLQRLAGAVDELERIVRHFDEDSLRSGYGRAAALWVMTNNSERLIRDQATRMEENVARLNRLRKQREALAIEGAFLRFTTFLMTYDRPLVNRTYASYAPSLPLTTEGASRAPYVANPPRPDETKLT
jgi:hypothetical protein